MNNIYFLSGTNISKKDRAGEWNKNRAKTDVYSEPMPNRGISQYNNSFIQDPYTQDDIEHINPANGVTSLSFSGTKPVNTFTFAQPCITTNSTNRISFF